MRIRLRHDRLARKIAASRLSQNRWALRIGISTGHLSELVNGKRPFPSASTRRKLLEAFDAELEELFEIEGAALKSSPCDRRQQPGSPLEVSLLDWKHSRLGLRVRVDRLPAPRGETPAGGVGFMRSLDQDVRYGLRLLRRSPGFTLLAAAALALGIGGNSLIFSLVYGVLLKPLDFSQPHQLVVAYESQPEDPEGSVAYPNAVDWLEQGGVLESMGVWRPANYTWANEGVAVRMAGGRVSSGFFEALGVEPELGRRFLPPDDERGAADVAILGKALWERLGADRELSRIELRLDGRPFEVVGVLPERFSFPVRLSQAQVWTPLAADADLASSRGSHAYQVIARIKPGVEIAQAQSSLENLAARLAELYPSEQKGRSVRLIPLHGLAVRESRSALILFAGAVGLVLLIACANVGSLMLARGSVRRKELALRAALGAGRMRLMRQMLSESLLLSFLGGAAGLAVALAGMKPFLSWLPSDIPRLEHITVDAWVLAFAFGVTLTTALLCGIAPALQATRLNLNEPLSLSARSSAASGGAMHRFLVASEVAFALALLIVAGLFLRSFSNLIGVDPGFRSQDVLTFQVSRPLTDEYVGERQARVYRSILDRLATLPGVTSAGISTGLPLQTASIELDFGIDGIDAEELRNKAPLRYVSVSPDYLEAIGVPLLRGRLLGEDDRLGRPGAALVNEAFVQRYLAQEKEPLGKKILISLSLGQEGEPTAFELVGVVGDVRQIGLDQAPRPEMYVSYRQHAWSWAYFAVRTSSDPTSLVGAVRQAAAEVDPGLPIFNVATLREEVLGSVSQERFAASALGGFAGLALLLAAVGVYGVLSYAVSRRTSEIGLRMALGAKSGDILKLVIRSGLAPVAAGLVAGGLAAGTLSRLLSGQLFQLSPLDPATYAGVAAILLAASLAACYLPARRAAQVDPLIALRKE